MARNNNVSKINDINLGNIIAIVVLISLVGLGGVYLAQYQSAKTPAPSVSAGQTISYDCEQGRLALDILKEDNEVVTQDSEEGLFVTEINGVKNTDGSFWIFYVNGEMGQQLGVDQYSCQAGDKIEWRFEKIY